MAEQLDPKKIEEAKRLARELGIEFNEAQRSAKELDVTIAGFREELEKINSEVSGAFRTFKQINDQLKNADTITNNIKKGYSGLTSVAQTLQSVQSGYQNISLKEISNLREKTILSSSLLKQSLDARKLDEEALIAKIAAEKNVSIEQVKSASNAQKALADNLQQRKELITALRYNNNLNDIERKIINDSLRDLKYQSNELKIQTNILGNHKDKLNELTSLRKTEEERQKETKEYYDIILKKLNEEEIKQKRLNNLSGLGGNIIDGTSKAMDKLGLGGLKTYLNFDKAKEAMQQTAEKIESGVQSGNKLTVLSAGLKGLFSGMAKALMDPLAIMIAILDAFKTADKATGDLAKEFNITYKEASRVRNELNDIANLSGDINVTTKGLQESMVAVGKSLGTNAMLNEKDLVTFTKLREQAGYTNEELVGIQQLSLVNGKTLEDNTKEILGGAQAYAAQNKFVINEKEVLREVSKTSAAIKLTLGGSAEAVAKAVVQAKQFGLNLQQAEQISKSLLQFEDSIGNELQAELLTGKQFNFEQARLLALQGDVAGAAAEVAKQIGSAAQFGKMNVIQQEALAKAAGMTRDELAKSLMDKEALSKLSAREGETAQQAFNRLVAEVGLEKAKEQLGNDQLANQFAQQSAQDRFNATVEKLKEIFVSLVQPLIPILDVFMAITKPIAIIAGGLGWVLNKLSSILAWALEFKPVLYGLVGVLALTLLPKALSLVGSIGRGLAGAASSIKDMVTGSFKFVGNLISGEEKLKKPLAPKPIAETKGGGITESFSKINTTSLLKGAAAMAIASAGIYIFAQAIQELEKIKDWTNVAVGLGAFAVSMGVLGAVGNIAGPGLTSLGEALISFGAAIMTGVGAVGLIALTGAAIGLGFALKLAAPGIEAFGTIITAVFTGLTTLIPVIIDGFVTLISAVANGIGPLLLLGPALASASLGLGAFALALTGAGVASFIGGDIISKIEVLASLAEPINLVANSLGLMATSLLGVSNALNVIDTEKMEVLSEFAEKSAISAAAQGITTAITAPIQAISAAIGGTNNESMAAELKEIKTLLNQMLNKEGTVYLDGNKVGTILSTGASSYRN